MAVRSGNVLTPQERADLSKIIKSAKAERRMVFRASIVWRLAEENLGIEEVARKLSTTTKTVRKWQRRFI